MASLLIEPAFNSFYGAFAFPFERLMTERTWTVLTFEAFLHFLLMRIKMMTMKTNPVTKFATV